MLVFNQLSSLNMKKLYFLVLIVFINFELSFCKWGVWNRELEWWHKTIVYQIYPRSFQDSDGDGSGDLQGIISRLNHFNETGIDTIWLSPIFKSPMADLGYDISDFNDIDPSFGTLDDFKNLVKEVKNRGMYLLTDFVPNHTSDEHEWFEKSVKSIEPYKDYYVWRDGRDLGNGSTTYPNNWLSIFGGSGWTYNKERNQYYYHQFNKKQPDLNLTNPLVRDELKKTLKFWLDLGVDGFRMDAVKHLMEDPEFHDEACLPQYEGRCGNTYTWMIHNYTTDWPTTYDLLFEWRQFLEEYRENSSQKHSRIMLTESYSSIDVLIRYFGNETTPGAHSPFNFLLVRVSPNGNSSDYLRILNTWFDNIPEGCWPNWVTGNHDNHRVATRMGNELVDAFYMLPMLLPGIAVTYQGEEIGQHDTPIRPDQVRDPNNNGFGAVDFRDAERGPFLWDDSENAGFTSAKIPWEPVHPSYWEINLESQKKANRSHYKIYKQIAELRKTSTIQRGDLFAKAISTWVFAFIRSLPGNESYFVVINFGSELEVIALSEYLPNVPSTLGVAVSSINSGYMDGELIDTKISIHSQSKPLVLRPKSSVVLTSSHALPNNNSTESPSNSNTGKNSSSSTNEFKNSLVTFFSMLIIITTLFGGKNISVY